MIGAPLSPAAEEEDVAGLSAAEVADRVARGQTNASGHHTSRTFGEILRANVLTRFNFILGTLLVVILAVGHPQDAVFGLVLVSNTLIGVVQELRAKRTLDRLAVLNAPRANVVRDGQVVDVAVEEVVLDDLMVIRTGDQLVADGVVTDEKSLQVDESLLTGESDPVDKALGDQALSGSFVVAGSGRYRATAVGADAYARKLASEARQFTRVRSELVDGINRILRYITFAIPFAAALLLWSQFQAHDDWREALAGTVAGIVGMVPQGLVLLTSVAFGVAAITLARRKVLVQELPAVEGLARVDVVCCDKTGTLTDGSIAFDRVERLHESEHVEHALGALADDENRNGTLVALADAFPPTDGWIRTGAIPFSSARKWSAATFGERGSWVLGAPEMVLGALESILEAAEAALSRANQLADTGERVLVLGHSQQALEGEVLPEGLTPVALVVFAEQVRSDAEPALGYFAEQGVAIKVISGDSPHTVGAVAGRVGLPHADKPFDARQLPEDIDELAAVLEEHSVFGRVTPRQKQAMVKALQARGHTVAMFGDGVNDALALKLADTGVAMGNGAPATKAVAQLVLLDGRFSTMPGVVAEGRRVTANIERVANLFVTKSVWATILAVVVGVTLVPYPFLPRHLTVVDALSIGAPAFFLALAPNLRRYVPGFVGRVLRFVIPAGVIVAGTIVGAFWLAHSRELPINQQRTAAAIVTLMCSLTILVVLAMPMTWRRALLVGLMIAGFVLIFPIQAVRNFAAMELPASVMTETLLIGAAGVVALAVGLSLVRERATQVTPGGSPI
ncbi:MAG: HAD-IC family P-type ATPase [Candidatus Dormiibacterota bacterium]